MSLAAPNASGASVFRYLRFERNKRAVTDVMSITLRRRLPATTPQHAWGLRRDRSHEIATAIADSRRPFHRHARPCAGHPHLPYLDL